MKTALLSAYLMAILFCVTIVDPVFGMFVAVPGVAWMMVRFFNLLTNQKGN